jgi:hypothetical protein
MMRREATDASTHRYCTHVACGRHYLHGEEAGTAEANDLDRLQQQMRRGTADAPDEAAAVEKAAAEFKVLANRLMAIRR